MSKTPLPSMIVIMILGFLLGITIIFASLSYNMLIETRDQNNFLSQAATYRRSVEIVAVNIEEKQIVATALDRDMGTSTFLFTVTENTQIIQQDPIIENDIVTAFSPARYRALEDIMPGDRALVRLLVQPDGTFIATHLTTGTPFARP